MRRSNDQTLEVEPAISIKEWINIMACINVINICLNIFQFFKNILHM